MPRAGVENNEVLRHKPFQQRSCREPVSRTMKFFAISIPGNKLAGSRHRERQSSLLKIKAFLATSLPEAGIENVKVLCRRQKPSWQASIAGGCECQESSTANQSCWGLQYQISLSSLIMHPLMDWGMRNPVSSRKLPCSLDSRPWAHSRGQVWS